MDHVSENVLVREFTANLPNEKWSTDITEKKDNSGRKIYLYAIIDLYDHSLIAYKLAQQNDNQLVKATLEDAFKNNPKAHPIFHSDRGYQYTSYMYQELKEKYGFTQSMSRAG